MARRFGFIYGDGSITLLHPSKDLYAARDELMKSHDDDDTEIIEADVKIMVTHGKPKLKVVHETCITCPTCHEEIYLENTVADGEGHD